MGKIKDRIILGSISGLLIGIPFQILNAQLHKNKITDISYGLSASKLFLVKNKTKTTGGKALAVLINCINAGLTGTAITYLLAGTGKDKATIKGAGVGAVLWVMVNGLLSNVGLNIKSKKPITPLLSFFEHAFSGALMGFLVTKFGDDSLFPDQEVREQDKIPILYTASAKE